MSLLHCPLGVVIREPINLWIAGFFSALVRLNMCLHASFYLWLPISTSHSFVCLCIPGLSVWVYTTHGWLQCALRAVHQPKAICLWTAPSGEIYHHRTWPLIMPMDSLPLDQSVHTWMHAWWVTSVCACCGPLQRSHLSIPCLIPTFLLKYCRGHCCCCCFVSFTWLHP